jgi:gliding motility-associated lipoprotein GldH
MNRLRLILPIFLLIFILHGCTDSYLVDTNIAIAENNWAYAKSIKATIEIKDSNKPYVIRFKLRHTASYRYANLYVILHLKGDGVNKHTRYQFKLAKQDGEWLGKGSGDIYAYNFPLLTSYYFPKAGKYEIEIEQNMRDNPLVGISDVGINVAQSE